MREPNTRERRALRRFVGDDIEAPAAFPGAGEKTLKDMVAAGWIEWVDSLETNEHGYRITEEGRSALNSGLGWL